MSSDSPYLLETPHHNRTAPRNVSSLDQVTVKQTFPHVVEV
ncbi:MAG: hypothetical protein NZ957_02655 [Thaumarchaeota archaeon]|nr:hypothetical protein [Candidatus Calditenuaceae archaeon]